MTKKVSDTADKPKAVSRITRYGLAFGPARVHRSWSHKGYVGLNIFTGKQMVDITVTPSGLIRLGEIEKDWHTKEDLDE